MISIFDSYYIMVSKPFTLCLIGALRNPFLLILLNHFWLPCIYRSIMARKPSFEAESKRVLRVPTPVAVVKRPFQWWITVNLRNRRWKMFKFGWRHLLGCKCPTIQKCRNMWRDKKITTFGMASIYQIDVIHEIEIATLQDTPVILWKIQVTWLVLNLLGHRWSHSGFHGTILVYFPTFTIKKKQPNVGEYTIDGWYGSCLIFFWPGNRFQLLVENP